MVPLLYAFAAITIVSLTPTLLFLGFFPTHSQSISKRFQNILVSTAVGSLLGDAIFHLIPEALNVSELNLLMPGMILIGMLIFLAGERILQQYHRGHGHNHLLSDTNLSTSMPEPGNEHEAHAHEPPMFGMLLVSTDIMHSFVDGLAIGVSFQTSKSVGISTSIAVLLHEAPHLLGDFSLLQRMGYTRMQLLYYSSGTIFASYLGSLLAFSLSSLSAKALQFDGFRRGLLGFAAGNFLYIALADLVPEILQGRAERTSPGLTLRQSSISQLLCVASGSLIMFLIKKFE